MANYSNFFFIGAKEVMSLLGCSRTYAYNTIKELREELSKKKIPGTNRFYSIPKEGSIQLSYFCETYMIDRQEAIGFLKESFGKKAG